MTGLALQIDGKWAVLGDGDSVNIENNSPVWGEGNSFSLPFELDIEANRHIIGNADQITGESVYKVLDGKRAVLYTLGIPVYYGKIKMEDEVELSDGKVDVTLVSGNLTFDEMIKGVNCQEVELLNEIELGKAIYNSILTWSISSSGMPWAAGTAEFRMNSTELMKMGNLNVTRPYSRATPFCNIRLCYQKRVKEENGDYRTLREYEVLEYDRKGSSPCFYLMYFLDCLFAKLNIAVDKNTLGTMEDMNRLAFVNTKCAFDVDPDIVGYDKIENFSYDDPKVKEYAQDFNARGEIEGYLPQTDYFSGTISLVSNKAVANSKNFPNVDVSEVIDALKNGFGVLFIYDEKCRSIKLEYVKDILRSQEVLNCNADIFEAQKSENNVKGFRLTYSGGEDNTSFNYSDYSKVNYGFRYKEIRANVNAYDETCYIDTYTGDRYRYKVDKDAEKEEEWFPSTFEVGAFNKFEYGDCSNENCVEVREIGFTPIEVNDVYKKEGGDDTASGSNEEDSERQTFALFVDAEMNEVGTMTVSHNRKYYEEYKRGLTFEYSYYTDQNYDRSGTNESPIQEKDWGLMLGIMRGPGNDAGIVDFDANYDGEGNSKYETVVADYSFTSDIMDNYGHVFDYNGTEEGGVTLDGRFSLKLKAEQKVTNEYKEAFKKGEYKAFEMIEWSMTEAEKEIYIKEMNQRIADVYAMEFFPIVNPLAQKRGLFDKFYAEYAYFVVNRKIVRMTCRMEMADLLNIDWTKRYKIGEYVGFINKYSYSVSSSGISDVELEMYYI